MRRLHARDAVSAARTSWSSLALVFVVVATMPRESHTVERGVGTQGVRLLRREGASRASTQGADKHQKVRVEVGAAGLASVAQPGTSIRFSASGAGGAASVLHALTRSSPSAATSAAIAVQRREALLEVQHDPLLFQGSSLLMQTAAPVATTAPAAIATTAAAAAIATTAAPAAIATTAAPVAIATTAAPVAAVTTAAPSASNKSAAGAATTTTTTTTTGVAGEGWFSYILWRPWLWPMAGGVISIVTFAIASGPMLMRLMSGRSGGNGRG